MKNIFLVLTITVFAFGVAFAIKNRNQMAARLQNESLPGSPSESALTLSTDTVNEAVEQYLPNKIIVADPGAHVFCSHHTYGFEEDKDGGQISAYVWAYCEEYFLKDGKVTMGQGVSYPIKILLKIQNGKLVAVSHEEPVDGSGYGTSIQKMFPEKYASGAIKGYDITKFALSPEEQANIFYSK